jgi:hypothetical protein
MDPPWRAVIAERDVLSGRARHGTVADITMERHTGPGRDLRLDPMPFHAPRCRNGPCPGARLCAPTLLPPSKKGPTALSGDQALTCTYLVAGAGFEPATSGL